MHRWNIATPSDALAYFTDCTLATVCDMAMTKSRKVGEYKRQKTMAQHMCDFLTQFKIADEGNRYNDVIKAGSVEAWAIEIEKRFGTFKG